MNSPAASWNSPASRRTVLATALAAAGAGALSAAAPALAAAPSARSGPSAAHHRTAAGVDNRFWSSAADWRGGTANGTKVLSGGRSGLAIATPAGSTDYTDPHTGSTSTWEYATWTSPVHRSKVPATEAIASWNADTPAGTWIQTELRGTYSDGAATPGT